MKETLFVPKIIKDDNTYWGVEADNSNFNFDSIKQSFQRLRETTMVSSAEGETINSITELNQYTTQGSYSIHLSDGGNGSLPALNGAYDFTLDVRRASDNGSIIIQQQIFSDKVYQRIVPNTVWTLVSNDYATQRKLTETLNKLSNILDIDNTTGSYLKRKIGDKTYYLGINDTPAPVYISYNELGVSKIEELATKQYVDDVLNGDIPSAGFATKQYVDSSIAKLVGSSPDTLDTLYELAEALGNDPNFSETVFSEIGKKWTQDNNLINKWNKFADYFERVFKIYYTDSTNTTIERVEVLYPFNSVSEIWAYGAGEMGGGGGNIGSLYDLPEISINPETLQTGDVLIYNKTTTHWYAVASSTLKPDLSGYVTTTSLTDTLKDYVLTTTLNSTLNNYVTTTTLNNTLTNYVTTTSLTDTLKDYVLTTTLNSEVEKLKKVTDVFKIYYTDSTNTTIERVEVLYPFNSVSEIWAYGAGEMGGGGSLISNVYGYSDLGNTYLDADLDNTFNAYTINRLAERIGALETGGGGGLDEAALETYLTTNNYYYSGNSNKSDVNWTANRLTTSGVTLNNFSTNLVASEQWVRVFTSSGANNGSSINSVLLMIGREYNHEQEESYTFMVTVGYDGRASINQLSSSTGIQFIDKVRLLWKNGTGWYIDIHYTGTVGNGIFVSGSGCGDFSCSLNSIIPEGYTAKEFNVWRNSVCFSNSLILDTGIDTKLIFNNTDGEKYSAISFRENNVEYVGIAADGRDGSRYLSISGIPTKVDSLYFNKGTSFIREDGSLRIGMGTTGGNAIGSFYYKGTYAGEALGGIGCYTENGNLGYYYIGWTSSPYNVNTNFHVNSERIRWKGQDILTSGNYQNYPTNKVGDGTMYVTPQYNNEVNFGGSNNSSIIYFGYRATDSKPIPSQFMFGGSNGQSNLIAKGYTARDTSSYMFGDVSIAHSFSTTPRGQVLHAQWLEGVDTGSYMRCVILLVPVIPTTNTSEDNALQGTFFLYKTGGCITDRIEIYINSCWNEVQYNITESGMNTGATLNRCTYGGVDYYCLNLPYHANPYTRGYFTGWCHSNLSGGVSTVALPKFIRYKNDNTGEIINSEINNSLTGTLTTSVVTSASRYGTKFTANIAINGEVNATGDIKTPVWMYAARFISANGHSLVYIGNSSNENWVGIQDMCSAASIGDTNWSVRVAGDARFRNLLSVAADGVTRDDGYGICNVTRGTASNFCYFSMVRSNQVGMGIGISTGNDIIIGGANGSKLVSDIYMRIGTSTNTIKGKLLVDAVRHREGATPSISLAIGDNDTGFNWITDGQIAIYANGVELGNWTSSRLVLNKHLYMAGGMNVYMYYNGDKPAIINHGNGNTSYNALGGAIYFAYNNTTSVNFFSGKVNMDSSGNISGTGEVTAYSGSDLRLKKNVEYLKRGLSIVRRINPIQYYWNEIGVHYKGDTWKDKKDISICSAQEMELVLPEIVHTMWDTEYIGYEERKILPYIINSIKQLDSVEQELISIQKNMIEILEQTDLNQKQQELMMGLKLSLINLKNLIS